QAHQQEEELGQPRPGADARRVQGGHRQHHGDGEDLQQAGEDRAVDDGGDQVGEPAAVERPRLDVRQHARAAPLQDVEDQAAEQEERHEEQQRPLRPPGGAGPRDQAPEPPHEPGAVLGRQKNGVHPSSGNTSPKRQPQRGGLHGAIVPPLYRPARAYRVRSSTTARASRTTAPQSETGMRTDWMLPSDESRQITWSSTIALPTPSATSAPARTAGACTPKASTNAAGISMSAPV